jgi:hypothetical protein
MEGAFFALILIALVLAVVWLLSRKINIPKRADETGVEPIASWSGRTAVVAISGRATRLDGALVSFSEMEPVTEALENFFQKNGYIWRKISLSLPPTDEYLTVLGMVIRQGGGSITSEQAARLIQAFVEFGKWHGFDIQLTSGPMTHREVEAEENADRARERAQREEQGKAILEVVFGATISPQNDRYLTQSALDRLDDAMKHYCQEHGLQREFEYQTSMAKEGYLLGSLLLGRLRPIADRLMASTEMDQFSRTVEQCSEWHGLSVGRIECWPLRQPDVIQAIAKARNPLATQVDAAATGTHLLGDVMAGCISPRSQQVIAEGADSPFGRVHDHFQKLGYVFDPCSSTLSQNGPVFIQEFFFGYLQRPSEGSMNPADIDLLPDAFAQMGERIGYDIVSKHWPLYDRDLMLAEQKT